MYYYKSDKNGFVEFYIEDINTITDDMIMIKEEAYKDLLFKIGLGAELRILQNGEIGAIFKPDIPDVTLKPEFDYGQLKWIETATQKEIDEHNWREVVRFYNQELEFASKANVELACGMITEDVFEEVKTYMKSIDPYAGIKTIPEVKRPEIFKKYL